MLISLFFFVMQLTIKPFKRHTDNDVGKVIHLCLTLTFVCALLLKVCNQSSEACESFGFDAKGNGLFLFFVIFSLLVTLGMLLSGIYRLVLETTHATGVLQWRATGEVPELSLSQGATYHLFLSHVWSSAQDQVAVIKRCRSWQCPAG